MKVQVDKASLIQVLQRVQNITDKKTTLAVLSNALIRALDNQVMEFSATDLELSVRTHMPGNVEAPGSRCVSARKVLEIVRELPQEQLSLEMLPSGRFSIRAGRARFELATIPAEDFPHVNFYEGMDFTPCSATQLRSCLERTLYAIPVEDDPFSIAGLYCHCVGPELIRFAASDGHRLACSEMAGESLQKLVDEAGIIIPRKGVQEILRMVEKEEEVFLSRFENSLILKTSESILTIQLMEAQYPEYRLIIPEERPFSLQIDKETFHSALKRTAVLTNQKWRHVRILIDNGALELESGDPELGKATDTIDIEYEGEGFNIAFNVKYVLEAVQAIEGAFVRFEWVDQFHGGVFLDPDDSGYLALIMPMVV